MYGIADKFALLLSRGANCQARDLDGSTCLHLVLQGKRNPNGDIYFPRFANIVTSEYNGEIRDILVLLITAGADVYITDHDGLTPSDVAFDFKNLREWHDALIECGFDPSEVRIRKSGREGWSSAIDPEKHPQTHRPRRVKLTFAEYLKIRASRRPEVQYYYEEKTRLERLHEVMNSDLDRQSSIVSGCYSEEEALQSLEDASYDEWQENFGSSEEESDDDEDSLDDFIWERNDVQEQHASQDLDSAGRIREKRD